jgi:carbon storage regulator
MLGLSRRKDEEVVIGGGLVVVRVLKIGKGIVRLGFEAPRELSIHRREVYEAIEAGQHLAAGPHGPGRGGQADERRGGAGETTTEQGTLMDAYQH